MNNIGQPKPKPPRYQSAAEKTAETCRKTARSYQRTNTLQRHKIKRLEAALVEILASCTLDTVHDIAREALSK